MFIVRSLSPDRSCLFQILFYFFFIALLVRKFSLLICFVYHLRLYLLLFFWLHLIKSGLTHWSSFIINIIINSNRMITDRSNRWCSFGFNLDISQFFEQHPFSPLFLRLFVRISAHALVNFLQISLCLAVLVFTIIPAKNGNIFEGTEYQITHYFSNWGQNTNNYYLNYMINQPLREKKQNSQPSLQKDWSLKQNQTSATWKARYNDNVSRIKKQLEDLRKATDQLRKKISENQSRIKNALQAKASKQAKIRQNQTKENQNPQETAEDKETVKLANTNTITKKQNQTISTSSQLPEEQTSFLFDQRIDKKQTIFQKLLRYLDEFDDFLFRKIVKERIKPRKSIKNQQKQQVNRQKVFAQVPKHQSQARRINLTKSLRA